MKRSLVVIRSLLVSGLAAVVIGCILLTLLRSSVAPLLVIAVGMVLVIIAMLSMIVQMSQQIRRGRGSKANAKGETLASIMLSFLFDLFSF